jgi:iron complex outermembrane receptor protein
MQHKCLCVHTCSCLDEAYHNCLACPGIQVERRAADGGITVQEFVKLIGSVESRSRKTIVATALCGVIGAYAPTAIAQDDAALEEIVVTGQKRNESLQDIAVAVTVLSGEDLEKQGIQRLDDVQLVTPGLSITDAGLTQSVNIRGIGLASGSPNAANGVATYVDGVFQPPIVTTTSFYDIASVEVFRGPQGTFVGSNSTGGAIFINSRNPTLGGLDGYVQAEYGNNSRVGLEGAVNVPLSDTVAIRGAMNYRSRDSFYTNSPGLDAPAELDEKNGRVGLYWEATPKFSVLLKAEAADKSTGGYAYRPIEGTLYAPFRTNDIYTLNYSDATRNDEEAQQYTARLEYVTDGGVTLRSVSGFQNKEIWNFYDSDGTNAETLPRNTADQYVQEEVWTQEVNVLSPEDQPLRWIAGGYYQRNEILVDISNNPADLVHIDIDIQNEKTTTGLFGQVTYDFSEQLSVDAGLRYSTYEVTGTGAVTLTLPPPPDGPGPIVVGDPGGQEDDDQVTGKLALNWRPNEDHLFYVFYAKGYKSGGIASPTTTFAPETVDDYEAGWKGTLAGGAITTQVGAFYYDYKNFQLDVIDITTGQNSLINLTDATVTGVEAQIQADLGSLRVNGGFAYTDSDLAGTDFVDTRAVANDYPGVTAPQCPPGQPSTPPLCLDYGPYILSTDGGSNLYSPELTFNVGAEYVFELGNGMTLTPRLNYSYIDDRYTYIAYDPVRDRLPAYDWVNATVTLNMGRFLVELWGTNLTDEEYSTGQGGVNEYYGAPREYGLRAKMVFE